MSYGGGHPRVSSKNLANYVNEHVLLLGKVESLHDSEAKFLTHDGTVIVHAGTAIEPLQLGSVYQIMGKAIDDSSIKAFTATQIQADDLPPADFMDRLFELRNGPAKEGLFLKGVKSEI